MCPQLVQELGAGWGVFLAWALLGQGSGNISEPPSSALFITCTSFRTRECGVKALPTQLLARAKFSPGAPPSRPESKLLLPGSSPPPPTQGMGLGPGKPLGPLRPHSSNTVQS